MDKIKQIILCDDCGAEYTITYNSDEKIEYCPMCGADIYEEEDEETEEYYWDEDEWPYTDENESNE